MAQLVADTTSMHSIATHNARKRKRSELSSALAESRTHMPSPKGRHSYLGTSGNIGIGRAPVDKVALRLSISRTPVVDRLLGPAEVFGFGERVRVVKRLTDRLRHRVTTCRASKREWHDKLTIRRTLKDGKIVETKHDLSIAALLRELKKAFHITPYDPQRCRERLDGILMPLVIANRQSFPELTLCWFNEWRMSHRLFIDKGAGPIEVK